MKARDWVPPSLAETTGAPPVSPRRLVFAVNGRACIASRSCLSLVAVHRCWSGVSVRCRCLARVGGSHKLTYDFLLQPMPRARGRHLSKNCGLKPTVADASRAWGEHFALECGLFR